MTFLQQINLRCPVCETAFASLVAKVVKPFGGRRSDFREQSASRHALPYLIHVCTTCGYAGQSERFEASVQIDAEVREHVWLELATRLPISQDATTALPMVGSEKYESAAKIAEWQHADARSIADLWLRAAWCCEDEIDTEAERYFRRKAAWSFSEALDDFDGVPAEERAAVTYLVGELWRRIGDEQLASHWFARVPDEIVDFKAQEYILTVARRQAEEPEEWLP
jgi:hypothetical protein